MLLPRRLPLLLGLMLASATLIGCSNNRSTFLSTQHAPKNVEIIDTVSGESVWSKEIPVGQKLQMDYNYDSGFEAFWPNPDVPVEMNWALYPIDAKGLREMYYFTGANDSGTVELPGVPVRTVMTIRGQDSGTSDNFRQRQFDQQVDPGADDLGEEVPAPESNPGLNQDDSMRPSNVGNARSNNPYDEIPNSAGGDVVVDENEAPAGGRTQQREGAPPATGGGGAGNAGGGGAGGGGGGGR